MTQRSGPLRDIAVLDCTMALAGPFGTAVLADLGANVIKAEPPTGDLSRGLPPHPDDFATPASEAQAGCDYGGYFASVNRNKRSIALDLKDADDRELFFQLAERVDAVVENTRDGVMDRLGCGYEAVRARNPAIVYGAVRGFGDRRTGESPYADWPAFDIVAQCMGGLAHINGPEAAPGEAGGYPAGASVGDLYPGTLMALGVVAAVHEARRTGVGQLVDVGMYDAMAFLCETLFVNYSMGGRVLGPRGAGHPNLSPFGIYPANDGGVAIAAPGPKHWEALCRVMGRDDLLEDPRTATLKARVANQSVVDAAVSAWTEAKSKHEVARLLGGQVPCGPLNTAADLFDDPHLRARNMIQSVEVPGANRDAELVANPIKFTATPLDALRRAPRLDEHRADILREFGLPNGLPNGLADTSDA